MILGYKTIHPATGRETRFPEKIIAGKKIHTIRRQYRWKPGRLIHHAIGVRTKAYHCFTTDVCKHIQQIVITPSVSLFKGNVVIDGSVSIGGRELNTEEIKILAANDGFDSVEDFWAWFPKPLRGQIIHFTNFAY